MKKKKQSYSKKKTYMYIMTEYWTSSCLRKLPTPNNGKKPGKTLLAKLLAKVQMGID